MDAARGSRALRTTILVLASAGMAIVAAEALARALGLGLTFGRVMPVHEVPSRTVDGVVLWGEKEPRYNSEDLRRAASSPDAFTIVGLGDSILYGVGQEREQTYLERARRAVARRGSKRTIEILNLAVPGYNTVQEDAVHKEIDGQVKPDLVLVHYWADDGNQYRVAGGYVIEIGDMSADGRLLVRALPLPEGLNDFLLVHSRWYELLTEFAITHTRQPEPFDPERVFKPLATIQERARRAGGRLLVLASPVLSGASPAPTNELPDLQRFASARGIEVIDLSQWLSGVAAKDIAMDGCHFNVEGHRLLGERFAEYLLDHDLKE